MPKTTLAVTLAAAIALGGSSLQPAAAAPQAPVIAKQHANDFSAARKKRRHYGRGFPVAAFGAIIGTIAGIAAAEQRRQYYAVPYDGGPYPGPYWDPGDEEPYVYGAPDYYYAPGAVGRRRFVGPHAVQRPFVGHVGAGHAFAQRGAFRGQNAVQVHGGGRVGGPAQHRH